MTVEKQGNQKAADLSVVKGVVRRILFVNDESGFAVVKIAPEGGTDEHGQPLDCSIGELVVAGNMGGVSAGELILAKGRWDVHPRFGRQFKAVEATRALPDTLDGLRAYLGSGMIPGIGKEYARKIVDHFGQRTLDVLDDSPKLLTEVPGIGRKRRELIASAWGEHKTVRDVMIFLQSYGISPAYAHRIYKKYGNRAVFEVTANPYRLCDDIPGIGFKSADAIACRMGLDPGSVERVEAAIRFSLDSASERGHCFLDSGELYGIVADLIGEASKTEDFPARYARAIEGLTGRGRIETDTRPLDAEGTTSGPSSPGVTEIHYPADLYRAEIELAEGLARLASHTPEVSGSPAPANPAASGAAVSISGRPRPTDASLSEEQAMAVDAVMEHGLTVVTGGPGTGKTTTVKGIISALDRAGVSYALASPTGRAAKRLTEATGRRAKTVHRLLEFSPEDGSFARNSENHLPCDAVILDEASMLDLPLAVSLVKAMRTGSRLVLVGDFNQLPSVGPGQVLLDVMASGAAKVAELTRIFRQAGESMIVVNAHRIVNGKFPVLKSEDMGGRTRDFFFVPVEEASEIPAAVAGLVRERLPGWGNLDPVEDIQVIAPMHKGPAGVKNLNLVLKDALNPNSSGVAGGLGSGGRTFDLGDKVMQTRNNYNKEVFNGDLGRVVACDAEEGYLVIDFDGRRKRYERSDLYDLDLAYAISIHKSQGSEYPAVVIPIHTQHFVMLCRNLIYTAVTRAKRLVVLVGTARAISIAVRNTGGIVRNTRLASRLARAVKEGVGPGAAKMGRPSRAGQIGLGRT